jgi:hypothetical protein
MKPLQLTYKQFLAVLRKWDAYVWPEVKTMSRGIATLSIDAASQGVPPGASSAVEMKISELAKALWKSLLAGAGKVDGIHDEIFAEFQVEHFKEVYSSPEKVVDDISAFWDPLEPPIELFTKLGKSAQQIIVQDGLLQEANEVYKQATLIKRNKEQAEVEAKQERLREAREWRASPDYVRPIGQKTRERVRLLDKNQCAFCGAETHGSSNRYISLTSAGYKAEEVVLACRICDSTLEGKTPEGVMANPRFGRFSNKDQPPS